MEIKIPIEELRTRKIMVATPMYGGQCAGMFNRSMSDFSALCANYGIPMQIYYLFNESLITRARNYCVDEFMRSDAQHLMFIDSDIGFNPQDIIAMMALQVQDERYDIIGGPYPKKCISWEKIKLAVDKGIADNDPNILEKFVGDFVFNPKGGQQTIRIDEPVEVLEIGTGFMMITKNALQKFADSYPQYNYKPDHVRTEHFDGSREIMQFFQAEVDGLDFGAYYEKEMKRISELNDVNQIKTEIDKTIKTAWEMHNSKSKRYLSEDYWFCQKAQAIGLKTWLCPWMKTQHVGSYIFGGSLADLASIGASATADPSQFKKPK
ncbi:hypothetical protein UFOVP787_177 [uncultured Caudovirales phage]|uniref:Uncharacterized protein n=1 Tax=uncultured Caudovirales phage TaxID=2100421 RepID=A0A6J5NVU7_9CAUD|nr:hypothetical protein UFOVP787_177 [uncultured Caudovirales phage]